MKDVQLKYLKQDCFIIRGNRTEVMDIPLTFKDHAMPGQPIECTTSHKQLASIDTDALYLWCKRCNTQHAFSKQQVLRLWGINLQQEEESRSLRAARA